MNIVLLSGGEGKRLWPLSDSKPKQFFELLETPEGIRESMLQRTYRMLKSMSGTVDITVSTSRGQEALTGEQIGDKVDICVEPSARNTFGAILLAAAWLHDIKGVSDHEAVLACPVDSYFDEDYCRALGKLHDFVNSGDANIALLGIKPNSVSEKYGYIVPKSAERISAVDCFVEKPTRKLAAALIEKNALWNCGVFGFRLRYILDIAVDLLGTSRYSDIYDDYSHIPEAPFDKAVVEKEKHVSVMRYDGEWSDVGTWDELAKKMNGHSVGVSRLIDSRDTFVLNDLNVPVLSVGTANLIIAATPKGILVADKSRVGEIKDYM